MAMQTGMGLSKILVLAGAGYTGAILLNNGKLSDILGELQVLLKGLEKSGENSDNDSDYSDVIAQQVRRLTMEVRQLASARQITVLGGSSSQLGSITNLIIPATALGALGYGYMWWKGLKFSDLMYVTKRNMASAVSNLTKHLEQLSEALSAAKVHLTQRIHLLDDKMETQKQISRAIQNDVNNASENIAQIGSELWQLQCLVSGLDGKIGSLEEKQDLANMGVLYLCNFVGGKKMQMPRALEEQLKSTEKTRASLTYMDVPGLTGLKELADNLCRTVSVPVTDSVTKDKMGDISDPPCTPCIDRPRTLLRRGSARVL